MNLKNLYRTISGSARINNEADWLVGFETSIFVVAAHEYIISKSPNSKRPFLVMAICGETGPLLLVGVAYDFHTLLLRRSQSSDSFVRSENQPGWDSCLELGLETSVVEVGVIDTALQFFEVR